MTAAEAACPETTLVCCHYLGGSAEEWSAMASHLQPCFKMLAIDLPGFGAASGTQGYSVREMVDHVIRLVRGRHTQHWVLVGHSMGAKVAAAVARHAEDGASGLENLLTIVQVAGSPPSPEPMDDSKRADMLAMFDRDKGGAMKDAEQYISDNTGSPLDPPSRQIAINDALRMERRAWLAWLESGSKEDCSAAIGILETPALVIAGRKDAGLGAKAQRQFMLPHLSNASLIELAGAGHLLPIERPKELAELIARHVLAVVKTGASRAAQLRKYSRVLASDRVGQKTRDALKGRIAKADAGDALAKKELETLRALTDCLVPTGSRSFELAERVAQMLGEGQGDGWRPALLPADPAAYRRALATLNAEAKARYSAAFTDLDVEGQNALLHIVAAGQTGSPSGDLLTARQMQAWFEDLMADVVRLYVAHPETLARLGYSGVANGGDGQPKTGFVDIGLGVREAWEPVGEPGSRT